MATGSMPTVSLEGLRDLSRSGMESGGGGAEEETLVFTGVCDRLVRRTLVPRRVACPPVWGTLESESLMTTTSSGDFGLSLNAKMSSGAGGGSGACEGLSEPAMSGEYRLITCRS